MDRFRKWFPVDDEEDADDFFNRVHNFMRYSKFNAEPVWKPAMDIFETDSEVIIFAEIAGVNIEEINLNYENGVLRVSGNKANEKVHNLNRVGQLEIEYGRFERVVKLPHGADADKIKVSFNNGILKIIIPLKIVRRSIKITPE